jgi:hypothetical protein
VLPSVRRILRMPYRVVRSCYEGAEEVGVENYEVSRDVVPYMNCRVWTRCGGTVTEDFDAGTDDGECVGLSVVRH